jgi:hypothetical protein
MEMILTTCMNRNALLLKAVKSWLPLKIPILVIDWSSKKPVESTLNGLPVQVIRVKGERYFHLSRAKNLALREAVKQGAEFVFAPDCDVILEDAIFYPLLRRHGGVFYRGTGTGLVGTCFMDPEQALSAGGYDENVQGYTSECADLYNRMKKAGGEMRIFPHTMLRHQDHDGRLDNYPKGKK